MSDKLKIKICVPYRLKIDLSICGPSIDKMLDNDEIEYTYKIGKGYDPARSRNAMVSESYEMWQTDFGNFDYHLFHDSDCRGTHDDVKRLVSRGKSIISGGYICRDNPETIQAGFWKFGQPGIIGDYLSVGNTGVHRVNFLGGGFLLVKSSEFAKMEHPWFRRDMIREGTKQGQGGEDYGFCMLAERSGVEVWIDCDTKIEHVLDDPTENML